MNTPQGTAANVLVGPARMLVAPIGSDLPTLDGTEDPVTWPAAWEEVGYTDSGTDLTYNPTVKDINVDEEMAPVKKILDAEKATISCKCAEATLTNLNRAISASTLTPAAADASHAGIETLELGSGSLNEVMVGLEGLSPAGKQRVVIGFRAMAQANVQMAFKRGDKTITPLELGLLADSTKAKGKRLLKIVDFLTAKTPS